MRLSSGPKARPAGFCREHAVHYRARLADMVRRIAQLLETDRCPWIEVPGAAALPFLARAQFRQYLLEQEAEFERLELDADASEPELQFVLVLS